MKTLIRRTLRAIPWIILSPVVVLAFPLAVIINVCNWSQRDDTQTYKEYFKESITEFFDMERCQRRYMIAVGSGVFLFFSLVWPGAAVFMTDWVVSTKIILCVLSGTLATWGIILINWWDTSTYC